MDRSGQPRDALGRMFVAQRAALLRYLRARGAAEDAEDLLQELWLKVEGAGEEGVAEPLPYLYRMAHNLMVDRRRSNERRMRRDRHYQGASDLDGTGADATPDAERSALARDSLRRMDDILAGLGERTDHIFRRHRVDGVSQRQIAEDLGISLSGVEKHLQKAYRAVVAARVRMEEEEGASRPADGGEGQ